MRLWGVYYEKSVFIFNPWSSRILNIFSMPDVHKCDDYDKCIGIYSNRSFFCAANAYFKPNPESNLYLHIKYFQASISDTWDMTSCSWEFIRTSAPYTTDNWLSIREIFCWESLWTQTWNFCCNVIEFELTCDMWFQLIFDSIKFPYVERDRAEHNKIINKCIKYELMDSFNLSAFSSVEYCIHSNVQVPFGEIKIIAT